MSENRGLGGTAVMLVFLLGGGLSEPSPRFFTPRNRGGGPACGSAG